MGRKSNAQKAREAQERKEQRNHERNTHFLGVAHLVFEDLKPDLTLLFTALGSPLASKDHEISSAERIIEGHLAQCLFDFTSYVLHEATDIGYDGDSASDVYDPEDIDDFTAWPKQEEE